MNNEMITQDDYLKGFEEVCAGLSANVNDGIVAKCYRKTGRHITKSILKNVFKYLEENGGFHPTYKDFIQACFNNGFKFPMTAVEGKGFEVGSCGLSTCDGGGMLIVRNKKGNLSVFRCHCRKGQMIDDTKSFCPVSGKKMAYPIWNNSFRDKGYEINNVWESGKAKVQEAQQLYANHMESVRGSSSRQITK